MGSRSTRGSYRSTPSSAGHFRTWQQLPESALLEVLESEVPVRETREERLDVLGSRVSVVDVIGVLPHIHREERLLSVLHRQVGVRGLRHGELTVLQN